MGKIALTCVLALVFGFGGAAIAFKTLEGSLHGPQGETGLSGAPGPVGPAGQDGGDGVDGVDGVDGKRGAPGKVGKPAKPVAATPIDLGSGSCSGRSVEVITDVAITGDQRIRLTKKDVCVVE